MGRAGDRGGPHLNAGARPAGEGETFDRLVREGGDFNPFTERGWATLARRFLAVSHGGGLSILDIGCGTGRSRSVYAGAASTYFGVDLSFEALRAARARSPEHPWIQADACRLPFAERSFDAAAFSSVLHHIPDRAAALTEAFRVLRPGGLLFAFDPNVLHPAMALFRHPASPLYTAEGVSPHERPLLPAVLRREVAAAGFVNVGQRAQSDIPYRAVAPRGMNAALGIYNRLDRLWELCGLGRWFGSFVVSWGRVPETPE